MATLHLNSTTLDFVERGDGEPVVFVHGSASDSRTWSRQQDAFSARFRTIAYSRRHHWPNDPIPVGSDYPMDEHVDDLEALLRSLNALPSHIVAHSYGAFIALLLAARAPSLIRSLVLTEPPVITLWVSPEPRPMELLKLMLHRPRTALAITRFGVAGVVPATRALARGDRQEAMDRFGSATLGAAAYHKLSEERREQVRANFIDAELLGSGFPLLDDNQVRGIRARALLVGGRQSPALFHRLNDRLEELLPNVERIEIPSASHIAHEDNPEAFNEAVLTFLTAE